MKIDVQIDAKVYPTEDTKKVERAVRNIFEGELTYDSGADISWIRGRRYSIESMVKLKELIKKDRIRDAARKILYSLIEDKRIIFFLNKQVAFVNHISFCSPESESPLSPIRVIINGDKETLEFIINWLTEKKNF